MAFIMKKGQKKSTVARRVDNQVIALCLLAVTHPGKEILRAYELVLRDLKLPVKSLNQ